MDGYERHARPSRDGFAREHRPRRRFVRPSWRRRPSCGDEFEIGRYGHSRLVLACAGLSMRFRERKRYVSARMPPSTQRAAHSRVGGAERRR